MTRDTSIVDAGKGGVSLGMHPGGMSSESQMGSEDDSMINSRTFALALIGIASLYVFIMIYRAYQENKRRM